MRIRTIKPEFWSHPVMSRRGDEVRLCAIGLLNIADDEGYFLAEPSLIRSSLWPFDEDSTKARRCLDHLSECLYIEVREHPTHGKIGFVVNFTKHQRVDRPKPSVLKPYFLDDQSTINRRSIAAGMEGNREQGMEQGKEGKGVQGKTSRVQLTDEAWLSELSKDPTYEGIDVIREHGKMVRWCELKRKQPTRGRFVNWLNRAERPMNGAPRRPEANMVQETLKVREL